MIHVWHYANYNILYDMVYMQIYYAYITSFECNTGVPRVAGLRDASHVQARHLDVLIYTGKSMANHANHGSLAAFESIFTYFLPLRHPFYAGVARSCGRGGRRTSPQGGFKTIDLSIDLFNLHDQYLFIYSLTHIYTPLFIHLPIYLPIYPSTYIPIYPSIYLSIPCATCLGCRTGDLGAHRGRSPCHSGRTGLGLTIAPKVLHALILRYTI